MSLVLVVDDEESVVAILCRGLGHAGYATVAARDGTEACDLVAVHERELAAVVCDLTMPRMDGRQFAAALEQSDRRIPVLFVSGYSRADAIRRGLLPSGAALLTKPFVIDQAISMLGALIAGAGGSPASTSPENG